MSQECNGNYKFSSEIYPAISWELMLIIQPLPLHHSKVGQRITMAEGLPCARQTSFLSMATQEDGIPNILCSSVGITQFLVPSFWLPPHPRPSFFQAIGMGSEMKSNDGGNLGHSLEKQLSSQESFQIRTIDRHYTLCEQVIQLYCVQSLRWGLLLAWHILVNKAIFPLKF